MTRRRRKPSLAPVGRYDLRDAAMPPGEQLGEPPSLRVKYTRAAAISDPFDPNRRLLATINIKTDILETEYAHSRISLAAHAVGRELQAKFEQMTQTGAGNQWNSGDRVDVYQQHEKHIVGKIELARKITKDFAWIRSILGEMDSKILRNILGDRLNYSQCAVLYGKRGDRGARYIASRFRDGLEALATAKAAKGKQLQ